MDDVERKHLLTFLRRRVGWFLVMLITCCLGGTAISCLWYSPAANPSFANAERYPVHYSDKYKSELVKKAHVLLGPQVAERYALIAESEKVSSSDFEFIGLPSPSDETITTADGATLHGLMFQAPGAKNVVLYCSIWPIWRTVISGIPKALLDNNVSVFLYDYRGTGQSTGSQTLENSISDTISIYDYLVNQKKLPADSIVPCGSHLSNFSAVGVMKHRNSKCAILLEPAQSLRMVMGSISLPFAYWMPDFLFPDCVSGLSDKIGKTHPPLLILDWALTKSELKNYPTSATGMFVAEVSQPYELHKDLDKTMWMPHGQTEFGSLVHSFVSTHASQN